ncbi:MAG: aminopeptidase P N-terminal domain-containing protein [Gemmatimonadaceae bacterium]
MLRHRGIEEVIMRVSLRFFAITALLFVSIPRVALSQAADPRAPARITLADYADRRAELTRQIDSGVVLAFGEVEPITDWPTFFQLPAFEYLTGFDESDAVLLITKRKGNTSSTIFVPTRLRSAERFLGARTAPEKLESRIGIKGRDIATLKAVVDSLATAGLPFYIVPDTHMSDFAAEDSLSRGSRFVLRLRADHPSVVIATVDTTVDRMRARKGASEIALLRRAAEISTRAHREAMKATAPGCTENEIQAVLDGTFRRYGGDRPGYGSIVGGGKNATILHYMKDNDVLNDGDLLLIDAATSFDHYSADVTRTMPVNGKFTPAQRDIYQIVRDAQEAFVRQIKPGVTYLTASDSGKAVVTRGLLRLGLIESDSATFDGAPGFCPPTGCSQRGLYAWHAYGGHGIGLEVHDPAQYYGEKHQFQVGDVFTVEPGIYVSPDDLAALPDTPKNRAMRAKIGAAFDKYKWIGVRIEDDYALTESGLERLSAGAPREIDEIEALMREASPDLPGGGKCGRAR